MTQAEFWRTGFTGTGRISSFYREHGIWLPDPALGRPKKDAVRDRQQDYLDECKRVEVERRFSLVKRKCGLGLITARLRETAAM